MIYSTLAFEISDAYFRLQMEKSNLGYDYHESTE